MNKLLETSILLMLSFFISLKPVKTIAFACTYALFKSMKTIMLQSLIPGLGLLFLLAAGPIGFFKKETSLF